jgi:transcriptional regulator with XRE-family HTH domain
MSITKKLISKIKRLIQNSPNLNQKLIANRVNISESYLSSLLAGKRRAHIDLLDEVAKACGTTIQALIPTHEPFQHSNFKVEKLLMQSLQIDHSNIIQLSDSEKRIIKLYRNLNYERKQRVLDFLIEVLVSQKVNS